MPVCITSLMVLIHHWVPVPDIGRMLKHICCMNQSREGKMQERVLRETALPLESCVQSTLRAQ